MRSRPADRWYNSPTAGARRFPPSMMSPSGAPPPCGRTSGRCGSGSIAAPKRRLDAEDAEVAQRARPRTRPHPCVGLALPATDIAKTPPPRLFLLARLIFLPALAGEVPRSPALDAGQAAEGAIERRHQVPLRLTRRGSFGTSPAKT